MLPGEGSWGCVGDGWLTSKARWSHRYPAIYRSPHCSYVDVGLGSSRTRRTSSRTTPQPRHKDLPPRQAAATAGALAPHTRARRSLSDGEYPHGRRTWILRASGASYGCHIMYHDSSWVWGCYLIMCRAPEEDERLRAAIDENGECNWKAIAKRVGSRTHVQCLQRWKKVRKPRS